MRRRSSALIACRFATMRFFTVFHQTMNDPLLRRFPQWCERKGLGLPFATLLPITYLHLPSKDP
jgi:hypothetical protein